MKKKNLAVFVSGSGTNLQVVLDAVHNNAIADLEVTKVIADRECYALQRAAQAGVPTFLFPRKKLSFEDIHFLLQDNTDFILLAGFLSILEPTFCKKWKKKIMNFHPSLLPKYGGKGMFGMKVHQAVIQNQEQESGVTFHYVDETIDGGEMILQKRCPVNQNDTAETLANRIHQLEHAYLLEALKIFTS